MVRTLTSALHTDASVSRSDWAILIFGCLFFGAAAVSLPRFWRGEGSSRSVGFGSDALDRGWIRAIPLGTVSACVLAAIVLVGTFRQSVRVESPTVRLLLVDVPFWSLVAAFVAVTLLYLAVIVFNWPKRAVPPRYRSQTGAITDWFRSLKRH